MNRRAHLELNGLVHLDLLADLALTVPRAGILLRLPDLPREPASQTSGFTEASEQDEVLRVPREVEEQGARVAVRQGGRNGQDELGYGRGDDTSNLGERGENSEVAAKVQRREGSKPRHVLIARAVTMNAPEFELLGSVTRDLTSHPFRQTAHETDRFLARPADQAQRELAAEAIELPVRLEEDEQFEQPGRRVRRHQYRTAGL